ncbi:multipass membrane protein [Cuniculiplasma divulgatum]|uniref:Multipass membrane protein n=2 Tax=Cuniculiplasma divulgatum TaxID=1673428 RepID=A0A1R4A695_9ARCH|nr:multipass membrane protein [Cuniculiplasma divulgatum]
MSLTVSLAPFQILIYVFPTILFFISLMSRLILTFSSKNDIMKEAFGYAENILTETLNGFTNKSNIDLNDLIKQTMAKAVNNAQIKNKKNVFQNNVLTNQERKKRNSQFLYSLFIDSFALSIANGVIIMFEAQNLFYGFILLFIGVVLCLFGITALYADRPGFATFIVLIITVAVFLSELVYLLTSNINWFYMIPEYFTIATVVLVAIVGIFEYRKKRKLKQTTT